MRLRMCGTFLSVVCVHRAGVVKVTLRLNILISLLSVKVLRLHSKLIILGKTSFTFLKLLDIMSLRGVIKASSQPLASEYICKTLLKKINQK